MIRRHFLQAAAAAALLAPALGRARGAAAATKGPRPLEEFAALPFVDGPQISPDGSMFAAKVSATGRQLLAFLKETEAFLKQYDSA